MPKDRSVLSGYWCIDTFTPITSTAYLAARGAVDCALTAAAAVLNGAPAAYALVRPPGHHAEKKAFGGFCYFNNAAITAHFLSGYGRVAVLDIDYHHGNGTQDIFYTRSDVLTVSIHGDPSIAYPYFSGFRDETGRDEGAGYNLNLPLAETITPDTHRNALVKALKRISRHSPAYLVIALGLDIAKGDPTGTWTYRANDFARMGQMIAELGLPCVVVQEGGYAVRNLGSNARNFFSGIARGLQISENLSKKLSPKSQGEEKLRWRDAVQPGDAELVQALVTGADRFTPEQMAIAKAQVSERIEKGRISGYRFVVVEQASRLAGYACFGRITDSDHSYRLHQIVVTNEHKDTGLAQEILQRVEALVRDTGGRILLAEASSAAPYASLRDLYTESGFSELVVIQDFYRLGCSKLIFRKDL
jgi:acetoin utilization deacetylase AcuC-like enzyme